MEAKEGHKSFGEHLLDFVKKSTAIGMAVGAFFTMVGWIFTKVYHEELETFWETVEYIDNEKNNFHPELDSTLNDYESRINRMEKAWYNRESSFAIGIRADAHTGEMIYRHIDGEEYRMHVYEDYGRVFFTNKEGYLQEIFTFTKSEIMNW